MGTRGYGDVELAHKHLDARNTERSRSPQYSGGASAAYRWALGHSDSSPVTGAVDARGIPDLQLLTAEVDAAVVQMEDPTSPPGPADYSRGVHDALAWVCGHSDEAP